MTNTATAGNAAGQAEKEKVEKRRALGRGLASLFGGGPRVVTAPAPTADAGPRIGVPSTVAQSGSAPPAAAPQSAAPYTAAPQTAELRSTGEPAAIPASPIADSQPVTMQAVAVELRSTEDSAEAARRASASVPTQAVRIPAPVVIEAYAAGSGIAESSDQTSHDGPVEIYAQAESRKPANLVVSLAIADIDRNPFQTRHVQDDDALEELANSIKANGVVQPIVVRPAEHAGRYILILGERRLHASKKAGKTHIPALLRKVSQQQAAEMTIIENLQREDLSPLEQAQAFRVLSTEFKLTQEQIGERVGLSRASIANYMRLLKLPREVMELLAEKRINFAQAKELLKLENNDRIAEAAIYAVKKGMNLEQIEALVMRMEGLLDPLPDMPGQEKKKSGGARWVDPNVRAAQVDLERTLGLRVRIRDRKGKGKIVIEYATVDDYERVVGMLRGKA